VELWKVALEIANESGGATMPLSIKGVIDALLPRVLLLGCGFISEAVAILVMVKLQVAFDSTNFK
jgi:hypothetical protein